METATPGNATSAGSTTDVDVLIVGAGISGIGAAYHLGDQRPGTTFVILDALDSYGGTWLTHRYPGVRSDSDLYTLGYRFKPWTGRPIASGGEIMAYLGEVIDENDLARHIRYRRRVTDATWSSEKACWTVTVTVLDAESTATETYTAGFLWMCQGYYDHGEPYTPDWPGLDDYAGALVHPQHWPRDLDLTDKRVVVIGSGATAATLVPAIAGDAAHVTMLQRSPTYFINRPNSSELADTLRGLDVPEEWTYEIVRRQMMQLTDLLTTTARDHPDYVRDMLLDEVRNQLPEGFDVDTHFTPSYRPWQQRLAAVPDGDLFDAIRGGKVSMVTDTIKRFTPTGIETDGGETLEAEVVVTATGFNLSVLGDIDFTVDGESIDPSTLVSYRGIMFSGLPNLAYVFGYFRASWTLRADIISDFVCRVLTRMDERGDTTVMPRLRDSDADMALLPWVDPENFNPGYLARSLDRMPRRGDREPWTWGSEYPDEKAALEAADLDDGTLQFS
ncbi:MAG: NAD(P)/FAD-dependent oxidoreductase [Microthrixaceae bacterium]|nr:NAD(P)/FAD-dependent oxidoreductase [Microthrixaceae bacterium]